MLLRITLLFSLLLLCCPPSATAALAPAVPATTETAAPADLSRSAVEARLGRKLKLTERLGLAVARRKIARQRRRGTPAPGQQLDKVSLIAGILGILTILLLALAVYVGAAILSSLTALAALIMGIIGLSRTPRDGFRSGKGFAITGVIIGGLYYLLGLLALIVVIAILAAG